jgi:hypothetical protein
MFPQMCMEFIRLTGRPRRFKIALASFLVAGGTAMMVSATQPQSWLVFSAPNVPGSLNAVTCNSASDCWAVGSGGSSQTFIERWNGSSWSIISSPNALQSNALRSVTCNSATDCWAAGDSLDTDSNHYPTSQTTLLERWNGSSWSIVTSPNAAEFNALSSVTCNSASDCWTVGGSSSTNLVGPGPSNLGQATLIEHWNGSSWSIVDSPNGSDPAHNVNYIAGVTCTSNSDCWAVGNYLTDRENSLALHWDGASWAIIPVAGDTGGLSAVTCNSASDCWAVGTSLLHWDGNSWVTTPLPADAQSDFFVGVNCSSGADCWAVGTALAGNRGDTLTSHWDGSTWTTAPSANVNGNGDLTSVQCINGDCWAVGFYSDGSVGRVLVEQYVSGAPQITAQPQTQTVTSGSSPSFKVTAIGPAPLTYQWYFGSTPIGGANSSTLSLTNVQRAADAGDYSVFVSNQSGSTVSSPAALGVISKPITTVSKASYPSGISIDPNASSLVFITHGETPSSGDDAWIDTMETKIQGAIQAAGQPNWAILAYHWTDFSSQILLPGIPDFIHALQWAQYMGSEVGDELVQKAPSGGWKHIHFIAHSAGSSLVEEAATVVLASFPSTEIHITFLDPYVGTSYQSVYGSDSTWSDDYFAVDLETDYRFYGLAWRGLSHAFNVDVTGLDTNKSALPLNNGQGTPYVLLSFSSGHGFPIKYYQDTIPAGPPTTVSFGYSLSKEAGGAGWNDRSGPQYVPGNKPIPASDQSLAEFQGVVPLVVSPPLDYTTAPNATSGTGTVRINGPQFAFATANQGVARDVSRAGEGTHRVQSARRSQSAPTGAPVWIAVPVNTSADINYIQFDLAFTSSTGAAGLVTVYWNERQIAIIDEQHTLPGTRTYKYAVPGADLDKNNCLSFRLDPFSSVVSSATVANVTTGFIGLPQPITLAIASSGENQTLTLTGTQGFTFLIQASIDLVNWIPISAVNLSNSNSVQFVDPDAANFPVRFYQAVSP